METLQRVVERCYAWKASRAMLRWYRRVRRNYGQLTGKALYEQIIAQRADLAPGVAAGILEGAEQSFCLWPVKRQVRYQDVVLYVVVHEYLGSHQHLRGTLTNMGEIVSKIIPREL